MVTINVNLTKVRDHKGHPVVEYTNQNHTAPIFCPGNSSAKGGNDAGGGVGAPTGYNPYQMQMQEAPPPQVQMEVAPAAALPPAAATGPFVPPPDPGSKLPVYGEAAAPLPYSVNPTAAAPVAAAAPYPAVGGGYQQQPGVNPGYEPPPPYPTA